VAVVGESGSGKSTLGRIIMRLIEPDAGTVDFDGENFLGLRGRQLRAARRKVQIVFQDPFAALDPRQKVVEAIARGPMAYGAPASEAMRTRSGSWRASASRTAPPGAIRTNSPAASASVSASRGHWR